MKIRQGPLLLLMLLCGATGTVAGAFICHSDNCLTTTASSIVDKRGCSNISNRKRGDSCCIRYQSGKNDYNNNNNSGNNNNDNKTEIKDFFGAVAGATAQAAKDFSSALRFSAVKALTGTLPQADRELLLKRISAYNTNMRDNNNIYNDDVDDESSSSSSSVGENIAMAKISDWNINPREYDQEWQEEREILYQQAEQAAMERVENELEIQKQRIEFLQYQLELAGSEEQDPSKLSDLVTNYHLLSQQRDYNVMSDGERAMVEQLREQFPIFSSSQSTDDTSDSSSSENANNNNDPHPVLGPVLLDLGYKRIYTVSANVLGTIPVWNKQRIYRNDRVKSMASQKWKNMHLGLPGIICLHEDIDGKLTVLDGQHRIGMMLLLQEKQRMEQAERAFFLADNYSIDFDNILVEVFPEEMRIQPHLEDRNHPQELFVEINKGEPVTLLDMPGVASSKTKRIITDAVEQLSFKYPGMFSPGQRCDPPMVNMDNMRDRLYGSGVLKRHELTTSKALLEWLVETNNLLAIKYESNEIERRSIPPNAWMKASQNRFYLGLESLWYYT